MSADLMEAYREAIRRHRQPLPPTQKERSRAHRAPTGVLRTSTTTVQTYDDLFTWLIDQTPQLFQLVDPLPVIELAYGLIRRWQAREFSIRGRRADHLCDLVWFFHCITGKCLVY